ncbi:hypothetical protein EVAR_71197_1 [Eumeta japonica]|uniref:Uncharacterized protein n=1 Tax=Eumeta variegata TaxID=151549 RepID=A0A4C2A978_EUMVA|nr:hypothetical protein EVAR_71197_1 [Eumeta japonica]
MRAVRGHVTRRRHPRVSSGRIRTRDLIENLKDGGRVDRLRGVGEKVISPLLLSRGENVCLLLLFSLRGAWRLRECACAFVLQPATRIHEW